MTTSTQPPFGNWDSIISVESISQISSSISEPKIDGDYYYWVESRPIENGKSQIVQYNAETTLTDLLPDKFSARNGVHEYGGGVYDVCDNQLYFVNQNDQQIYSLNLTHSEPTPQRLTNAPNCRFADLHYVKKFNCIFAIKEQHSLSKTAVENMLVCIDCDSAKEETLVAGDDFYSSPRFNSSTDELVWVSWNHPNMPWDNTELHLAHISYVNHSAKVENQRCLLAAEQSVMQPQWSPTGELYCISDKTNWWNIFRYDSATQSFINVSNRSEDCAPPAWQFGDRHYCFIDDQHILANTIANGYSQFILIDLDTNHTTQWLSDYCSIDVIFSNQKKTVALAAGSIISNQLIDITMAHNNPVFTPLLVDDDAMDNRYISRAESITFGENDKQAHGFYYPPTHPDYSVAHQTSEDPPQALPPLIVMTHGGPTAMSSPELNLKIQFWTSRGFAVVDVNYRGSSGYGRKYRNQLHHQWGIADVEDCCEAVNYLANRNLIDRSKVVIRGSSAGGYTVLSALTFTTIFTAGCSLYGIGDLESLASDFHKFELRYLDLLVAPYPQGKSVYFQRSPINFADRINCPVMMIQGLKDKVVPPQQARQMAKQLNKNKVPHSLIFFENEAHGFKASASITKALKSEWLFYGIILGYLDENTTSELCIQHRDLLVANL